MGNSHGDQLLDKWIFFKMDALLANQIWETVAEERLGVSRQNGEDFKSLLTRIQKDKVVQEKLRNIDTFAHSVCRHIELMKRRLERAQPNKKALDDISKMRSEFSSVLFHLKRIMDGEVDIAGEEYNSLLDIESGVSENTEWSKFYSECLREATCARHSLERLNTFLEAREKSLPLSKGRPKTDQHGFVKVLAFLYRRYIGRPSSYENGPFAEVVRIALAAVGLPADDPSRAIRAALNDIH
ncbi:hypothetical protein [Solidesulfovibrio sp. C21]|uniref:hypothetical protein n=1 Tax=Solidesulfovibrio sp. C21 TaxID=3398613 RepID=UPI0039FD96AB